MDRISSADRAALASRTLAELLERTADDDRCFLLEGEAGRLPAVACGMANGVGGWIVLGASCDDDGAISAEGLRDVEGAMARLDRLFGGRAFSSPIPASSVALDGPVPLLAVRVPPAGWHDRPVILKGRGAYRRVEGVDVASGRAIRSRLALDAVDPLRDDMPVPGASLEDLHEESVAAFCEALCERRPEWAGLSRPALLSRALVLSGASVARAGLWLLGKRGARVRAELCGEAGEEDSFETRGLWRAYTDLLPRLTRSLTPACAAAFRECFVNALLHADWTAGCVTVMLMGGPASARIESPGMARTLLAGESACRNFRLMKIFQLLGLARGEGMGLRIVRSYRPGFELEQDMLELTTVATLELEPLPELGPPAPKEEPPQRRAPTIHVPEPRAVRATAPRHEEPRVPAPRQRSSGVPLLLAELPVEQGLRAEEDVAQRGIAPPDDGAATPVLQDAGPTSAVSFGSAEEDLARAVAAMRGRGRRDAPSTGEAREA